jgi:hypothetical protein
MLSRLRNEPLAQGKTRFHQPGGRVDLEEKCGSTTYRFYPKRPDFSRYGGKLVDK